MADEHDIIVLDDDDDDGHEDGPSHISERRKTPPRLAVPKQEPQGSAQKASTSSQNGNSQREENQKLFEEIVEFSTKLTAEHPSVIPFLHKRFSNANPSYLASVEFRNTLGHCHTRIKNKPSKVFVYINDLCTALKSRTTKRKLKLNKLASVPTAPQPSVDEAEYTNETAELQEQVEEKKGASKRQIRYLENLLRIYSQEIMKLQEKELTLEEMEDEDSTYMQECRLKRKLVRIFEKLCELKQCSSSTGRVIEQRIAYQGTRYQEINRRLEKFINKTRDEFPDYNDVFKVVQKANDKHSLGLTRKQLQSIAQYTFRDLGNKLQQRRRLDMVYNFGCHLTDSYKKGYDPAEHDSSLARRLRDNRNTSEHRLEDIIKKYADMQDDGEDVERKRGKTRELRSSAGNKGTPSHDSGEEEEEEEAAAAEEEDEESEESEVDIEEELQKSEQAVDDDGEDIPAEEGNDTDQKMEETSETSEPQNLSPGNAEGENVEDCEEYGEGEVMEDEGEDGEEPESSPGSTSLSPEKDSPSAFQESDPDVGSCPSPDQDTNSPAVVQIMEEATEQERDNITDCVVCEESNAGNETKDQLEDSGLEEDVAESRGEEAETGDVPYVEDITSTNNEQGSKTCTSTKTESLITDESPLLRHRESLMAQKESPLTKPKEVKVNRLDKFISKLTGSVCKDTVKKKAMQREAASSDSDQECSTLGNNETTSSGSSPKSYAKEQSSNGKLVCVDTPKNSWDSVRKIAFRQGQDAEEGTDVFHLSSCKDSPDSDTSNGVHRASVRPTTPVNRLKRKNRDTSKNSGMVIKVEEERTSSRKRKGIAQRWTENGRTECNGRQHGEDQSQQNAKRAKVDCSYTRLASNSEAGSDNEHDITLDLMVTCSPPQTPPKPTIRHNKLDVSTQCDPDEVIVLSD
ncbi:death domain-associated protein 6 isoform X2 [Hyperolius riggenbachi]|uniref:death domain-associated protein 6 isoform X2 n=1 Tax=Hyperolius riggenbachi TaxID=752182 RepID=UPI0035A29C6B